jgi:hypothetical protein
MLYERQNVIFSMIYVFPTIRTKYKTMSAVQQMTVNFGVCIYMFNLIVHFVTTGRHRCSSLAKEWGGALALAQTWVWSNECLEACECCQGKLCRHKIVTG